MRIALFIDRVGKNSSPLSHHHTCRSTYGNSIPFQSMFLKIVIHRAGQTSFGQFFFRDYLLDLRQMRNFHVSLDVGHSMRYPRLYSELFQTPFPLRRSCRVRLLRVDFQPKLSLDSVCYGILPSHCSRAISHKNHTVVRISGETHSPSYLH